MSSRIRIISLALLTSLAMLGRDRRHRDTASPACTVGARRGPRRGGAAGRRPATRSAQPRPVPRESFTSPVRVRVGAGRLRTGRERPVARSRSTRPRTRSMSRTATTTTVRNAGREHRLGDRRAPLPRARRLALQGAVADDHGREPAERDRDRPADRHGLREPTRRQHRVGVQRRDLQRREQLRLRADAGDGPGRVGPGRDLRRPGQPHRVHPRTSATDDVSMLDSATCNATDLAACPTTPRRPSRSGNTARRRRRPGHAHRVRDDLRCAATAGRCSTRTPATRPCNRGAVSSASSPAIQRSERRPGRPGQQHAVHGQLRQHDLSLRSGVAATPATSPAARPTRPAP